MIAFCFQREKEDDNALSGAVGCVVLTHSPMESPKDCGTGGTSPQGKAMVFHQRARLSQESSFSLELVQ